MALHLVRHADAGPRHGWCGDDDDRPLSSLGRARAVELATELAGAGVVRVLSSPARRCVETVSPLADALGLAVEVHPALAEGAPPAATWALLEELVEPGDVVACSHGDVIPTALERLVGRGASVSGTARQVAKGSVWTVEPGADGSLTGGRDLSG